ncbi:hypothetical protein ACFL6G_05835 [candidate division KSB1 bacterium]
MKSEQTINIPELYRKVINGCREKNEKAVGNTLNRLIKTGSKAGNMSKELIQVYELCLKRLKDRDLAEIRRIFERLIKGWTEGLMEIRRREYLRPEKDIEMEPVSEKEVRLRTADPVIADHLKAIRGTRFGVVAYLPTGEIYWNFRLLRRSLPRVLSKIRTPRYFEHFQRKYTQQLSFDF